METAARRHGGPGGGHARARRGVWNGRHRVCRGSPRRQSNRIDLTQRMVDLARERNGARGVPVHFLVGDMSALPFPDGAFDVVTTGYGIRNVPEIPPAVRGSRGCSGLEVCCSRLISTGRKTPSSAESTWVLDRSWLRAWLRTPPRSRHVPLHSGVDSTVSRRRRRARHHRGERLRIQPLRPRPRRADGDPHGAEVAISSQLTAISYQFSVLSSQFGQLRPANPKPPRIPSPESRESQRSPSPESRIPNPESRTPNPESRIPNPESRIPNPGPNPEPRIPSGIPNPESRIPNPESRSFFPAEVDSVAD